MVDANIVNLSRWVVLPGTTLNRFDIRWSSSKCYGQLQFNNDLADIHHNACPMEIHGPTRASHVCLHLESLSVAVPYEFSRITSYACVPGVQFSLTLPLSLCQGDVSDHNILR
jgi:hypothetical protein